MVRKKRGKEGKGEGERGEGKERGGSWFEKKIGER